MPLEPKAFTLQLLGLIAATWILPPLVGFAFLVYTELLSPEQVAGLLFAPWEPVFIGIWLGVALVSFYRFQQPLSAYLRRENPPVAARKAFVSRLRAFPVLFWGLFLLYLLTAPSSVILSAEAATDFAATPIHWFRIHLIALVVSIIVGLPFFFLALDLLGRVVDLTPLERPVVSLRSRVFLLGALMPLLVDTMLVQYFWSRTGYFTFETFVVWLALELLAIAGTLIFLRSMRQSYSPLEAVLETGEAMPLTAPAGFLVPRSTDEMGILAGKYRVLLDNIHAYNRILKTNARLLGKSQLPPVGDLIEAILETCEQSLGSDETYLLLRDVDSDELVAVAQAGKGYTEQGHYRQGLEETGIAAWIAHNNRSMLVGDCLRAAHIPAHAVECSGIGAVMGSPLISGGRNLGVLLCVYQHSCDFSRQEQQVLEEIAIETALAITTHQLLQERESTQHVLQVLNQRNTLLLESTSEGIIGVDTRLTCIFANRAAGDLLGYPPEGLVGQAMYPMIFPADEEDSPTPEMLPLYQAIREERHVTVEDALLRTADGSGLPVRYSVNPMYEEGSISGAVMVFHDITEARALARKMDYLATHDPLTGLPNRREFEARLQRTIGEVHDQEDTHVLCYLDLDQFKIVNDTCGHQAGDELLRQLATELHKGVRLSDTLARLGGDEFGLLLIGCPIEQALHMAEKLRKRVEDYRFTWNGRSFAVGCSIGVVPIHQEVDTVQTALSAADTACYVAKDKGRNRVHVYSPTDEDMAQRRNEMQWVTRLDQAIGQGAFLLRYQPIVPTDPVAGSDFAIEILLSLNDKGDRLVPPGAFIPAAERFNLMSSIDYWVVERVFAWLCAHRHSLQGMQHCFINLSGQSLGEEKFRRFVLQQLASGELPAEKICFEITETAAVTNLSQAITFMNELKQYGCHFALDDFGSGMSSFSYLKNLPLDYLKIDGNFVRDIVTDRTDRAMVQAIHQVGHTMHMQTIAEYVESPEIRAVLREIGIDYAQGWAIAEPRPLEAYLESAALSGESV